MTRRTLGIIFALLLVLQSFIFSATLMASGFSVWSLPTQIVSIMIVFANYIRLLFEEGD